MATTVHLLHDYLDAFSTFEGQASGSAEPWLRQLRRDAFARFYEVGFPTTHEEDWRFTNVSAIAQAPFVLAPKASDRVTATQLAPWHIDGIEKRLVFVNGHFAPDLSTFTGTGGSVIVTGLRHAIEQSPRLVQQHLGRYLDQQRDSFSALNTAFLNDGAFVQIPRETAVDTPIHLLFVSAADSEPEMNLPRNLIVAEEGSQLSILEDFVSLGRGTSFTNSATELVAADEANVSHYMIEREHSDGYNVSTLRIQQARGARVATHSVLLGGALIRNNVHPVLAGEGCDCLINGLFLGASRQHLDNYMLVEHAAPHCSSRQFYNGILADRSRGVFHGRIIVHKAAQRTDAKQTNRNLLLSDDAKIDTKPQLEIYADDVKCTHGATIGRIEDDALFYLRSRGIDEFAARRLLLVAFASECLDRMNQDPVRAFLEKLVREHVERIA